MLVASHNDCPSNTQNRMCAPPHVIVWMALNKENISYSLPHLDDSQPSSASSSAHTESQKLLHGMSQKNYNYNCRLNDARDRTVPYNYSLLGDM